MLSHVGKYSASSLNIWNFCVGKSTFAITAAQNVICEKNGRFAKIPHTQTVNGKSANWMLPKIFMTNAFQLEHSIAWTAVPSSVTQELMLVEDSMTYIDSLVFYNQVHLKIVDFNSNFNSKAKLGVVQTKLSPIFGKPLFESFNIGETGPHHLGAAVMCTPISFIYGKDDIDTYAYGAYGDYGAYGAYALKNAIGIVVYSGYIPASMSQRYVRVNRSKREHIVVIPSGQIKMLVNGPSVNIDELIGRQVTSNC